MTQQVITGIEAEIAGREPIATQTKQLYYTQSGFVMVTNGKAEPVGHAKAQKFLEKNAPEINIYKMNTPLLYR